MRTFMSWLPNWSVERVSAPSSFLEDTQRTKQDEQEFSNTSFNINVSFDCLHGTCLLVSFCKDDVCWMSALLCREEMTCPRVSRLLLIAQPSSNCLPLVLALEHLSLPAKSCVKKADRLKNTNRYYMQCQHHEGAQLNARRSRLSQNACSQKKTRCSGLLMWWCNVILSSDCSVQWSTRFFDEDNLLELPWSLQKTRLAVSVAGQSPFRCIFQLLQDICIVHRCS